MSRKETSETSLHEADVGWMSSEEAVDYIYWGIYDFTLWAGNFVEMTTKSASFIHFSSRVKKWLLALLLFDRLMDWFTIKCGCTGPSRSAWIFLAWSRSPGARMLSEGCFDNWWDLQLSDDFVREGTKRAAHVSTHLPSISIFTLKLWSIRCQKGCTYTNGKDLVLLGVYKKKLLWIRQKKYRRQHSLI